MSDKCDDDPQQHSWLEWRTASRSEVSKPASTQTGCFSLPSTNRKVLMIPSGFLRRRSTVSIYLKYPEIHGEVTTDGFRDWIELNSFQYGVSRNVSSGAGGNTRESSAPNIGEIIVTKHFDKASAKLYQDSVAGTFDTKVVIKMTTTTKNKTETFLTFELSDCGVSSYSLSSGGDLPMESLSLNFLKIMVTPTPLDKSGQIKKGDVVSYDLLAMKAS